MFIIPSPSTLPFRVLTAAEALVPRCSGRRGEWKGTPLGDGLAQDRPELFRFHRSRIAQIDLVVSSAQLP